MTKRRIAAILVPVLAAIGIAAGTAAATTSSSHKTVHVAVSPAGPAARPEVFNCQKAEVRPGSFTLACADGNDYLSQPIVTVDLTDKHVYVEHRNTDRKADH